MCNVDYNYCCCFNYLSFIIYAKLCEFSHKYRSHYTVRYMCANFWMIYFIRPRTAYTGCIIRNAQSLQVQSEKVEIGIKTTKKITNFKK